MKFDLEQWLRREFSLRGVIDYTFRAFVSPEGVDLYIHPLNQSGDTTPLLLVKGSELTIHPSVTTWPQL